METFNFNDLFAVDFEKRIDELSKKFASIEKTVSEFKNVKINFFGSGGELKENTENIKAINALLKEQKKTQIDLDKVLTEREKNQIAANVTKKTEIELNTEIQKQKQAEIKTEKDLLTLEEKKQKTAQKNITDEEKRLQQLEKINETLKKEVKSIQDLRDRTAALAKQRNLMTDTTGKNSKAFAELTDEINRNNFILKKSEEAVGDHRRSVGDYGKAIRENKDFLASLNKQQVVVMAAHGKESFQYQQLQRQIDATSQSIHRLQQSKSRLGQVSNFLQTSGVGSSLGLGFGTPQQMAIQFGMDTIMKVGKDFARVNIEFEKALSNLQAETGITADQLDYFKNKAIEMSKGTTRSASEVVDALKLIGSAKPELIGDAEALADFTDKVMLLSRASGLDLEQSTAAITGTLEQFNLKTSEASKLVDLLSTASVKGTVQIPQMSEALLKFGSAADAMGLSLEESTSLVQILGKETKLKGAELGTAIKSILGSLATGAKDTNPAIQGIEKAMDNLQLKIGGDVNKAIEIFGKDFYSVGLAMTKSKDEIKAFIPELNNLMSASTQAVQREDNLSTSIDKLGVAWDNTLLSLNGETGIFNKVAKNLVDLLADMLQNFDMVRNSFSTAIKPISELLNLLSSFGAELGISTKEMSFGSSIMKQFAGGIQLLGVVINQSLQPLITFIKTIKGLVSGDFKEAGAQVLKVITYGIVDLTEKMDNANKVMATSTDTLAKVSAGYANLNKQLEKYSDENLKKKKAEIEAQKNNKLTADELKKREEQLQKDFELETNIRKLRIDLIKNSHVKELETEKLNFEQLANENKKNAKALELIRIKHLENLSEINKKYALQTLNESEQFINDFWAFEHEKQAVQMEAAKQEELLMAQTDDEKEIINQKYNEEQLTAEKEYYQQQLDLLNGYLQATIEASDLSAEDKKTKIDNLNKQILTAQGNFNNASYNLQKTQTENSKNLSDKEFNREMSLREQRNELFNNGVKQQIEAENIAFEQRIRNLDKNSEEYKNAVLLHEKEISQIRLTYAEQTFNKILDFGNNAFNIYNDIQQRATEKLIENSQKVIDNLQTEIERERELQTLSIKNGVAYNDEKLKMLQGQMSKEQKIQRDQQKRLVEMRKRAVYIQLGIDMAKALSSAIREAADNPTNKLTFGAATAIQFATVAAEIFAAIQQARLSLQNVEQFGEGGWIDGPAHSDGGKMINAEGNEFIVRKQYAPQASGILEAVNTGKLNDNNIIDLNTISTSKLENLFEKNNNLTDEILRNGKNKENIYLDKNGKKIIEKNNIIIRKI